MKTTCALALAALFLALPAQAAGDGPHLVPSLESASSSPGNLKLFGAQFAAGAAATVVSVPAGLLLGSYLGTLSNNLLLAALPSLVLLAVLPPLAVVLAERLMGNWLSPGSTRILPALLVGVGVQILAIVAGVMAGVSVMNLGTIALFTLLEAIALPGSVTLVNFLRHPSPAPAPALVFRQEPALLAGLPSTASAPLFAFAF
ncbi:MAG: hypothetical protein ACYC8T_12595 [Myxococcaceae bacterium]